MPLVSTALEHYSSEFFAAAPLKIAWSFQLQKVYGERLQQEARLNL